MAIDFPNSPSVGEIFVAGGITRKWDGTTWSIIPTTITGPTGATGQTGATGAQGIQGEQGLTGTFDGTTIDGGTA